MRTRSTSFSYQRTAKTGLHCSQRMLQLHSRTAAPSPAAPLPPRHPLPLADVPRSAPTRPHSARAALSVSAQ